VKVSVISKRIPISSANYIMLCCEEMRVVGFKLQCERAQKLDTQFQTSCWLFVVVLKDRVAMQEFSVTNLDMYDKLCPLQIKCMQTHSLNVTCCSSLSQCSSYVHVITSRAQPPSWISENCFHLITI